MKFKGHLDIRPLGAWHQDLIYEAHYNPSSGYGMIDANDNQRYDPKVTLAHIARQIDPAIKTFFFDSFAFLDHPLICVQKMLPGMILPTHIDHYSYFKSNHKVSDINCIMRIIVFLEDWQSGHISEVDGVPNTLWRCGDWISWFGQTPHMAANIGSTDRYSLQITGLVQRPYNIS